MTVLSTTCQHTEMTGWLIVLFRTVLVVHAGNGYSEMEDQRTGDSILG